MSCDELELLSDLEQQLHDPVTRSEPSVLDALLANDFLEFGRSGGVYGKAEVVHSLITERDREPLQLTAYGYKVKTLATGVVLLTYRTVRKQEGAPDLCTLRSSLWKLTGNQWQIVFHQGTPTASED